MNSVRQTWSMVIGSRLTGTQARRDGEVHLHQDDKRNAAVS
jgi:hypothetical protein